MKESQPRGGMKLSMCFRMEHSVRNLNVVNDIISADTHNITTYEYYIPNEHYECTMYECGAYTPFILAQ